MDLPTVTEIETDLNNSISRLTELDNKIKKTERIKNQHLFASLKLIGQFKELISNEKSN